MSAFYWVIDHRAPVYMPRSEPAVVQLPIAFVTVGLVIPTITLTVVGLVVQNLTVIGFAVVFWLLLWRWAVALKRNVVRIPDRPGVDDYTIQSRMVEMQLHYKNHPELRETLEPALNASYDFARRGQREPISERATAMNRLVADVETNALTAADNTDLHDMRELLKIRQQMRRDGLL